MGTLRLVWRMLRRDWRAGELTVLGVALVLAVAALTGVGFLADRVEQGLKLQSHQLLGGDLLLSADHPWNDDFREEARRRGLAIAESASFPSMVMAAGEGEGDARLSEIKAVSDNYPLRGALRIAPALDAADAEVARVPARGEAWPEERLARMLGPGRLRVGALELDASAVLTLDPDRGLNAFALAPRLLINLADLPESGLIQAGSRVSWRLHLAGETKAIDGYRRWAEGRLGRGERLESLDNARPEIRNLLERAGRFLRLAALLTVVLAAVAVSLSADRYLRRHLDGCAVMRCLGAGSGRILAIHGGEFVLFGLLATGLGCLSGLLLQWGLQAALADAFSQPLPWPTWRPWAHGLAVGTVLVAGFVLPPLLRLRRVPTLRVLRREWDVAEPGFFAAYGFGGILLGLLMIWVAGELKPGLVVVFGFAAAAALFAGLAWLFVRALGQRRAAVGPWRLGVANLVRHGRATVLQATTLGLGLTTLLMLFVVRGDLLASWRAKVPPDAPNRFIINIQPGQQRTVTDLFARHGLPAPRLEPMVRGRLTAVNTQPRGPADYEDERARRLVEREFNLSWAAALPDGNAVVAGRWHGEGSGPQFSVEAGLAETLGLKIGDELTFTIAGTPLSAPITSLRKLDWDSMRVNFFVIAPPGVLEAFPASYITSFHLPAGKEALVTELVREMPNLTLIDVAALVRQVQDSLDRISRAVELLFALALAAGLVVLGAAIQAGGDERRRELAIMRALGGRGRQLRTALLAEFAALGAVAGGLASLGAAAIGWVLARFVFQLGYVPGATLLLAGTAAGVVIVTAFGTIATRGILTRPPGGNALAA